MPEAPTFTEQKDKRPYFVQVTCDDETDAEAFAEACGKRLKSSLVQYGSRCVIRTAPGGAREVAAVAGRVRDMLRIQADIRLLYFSDLVVTFAEGTYPDSRMQLRLQRALEQLSDKDTVITAEFDSEAGVLEIIRFGPSGTSNRDLAKARQIVLRHL